MTSAQSTRNTSIRTRKIRGDESLVSSTSIAARGEGFWGIAGGIHGVKARSGRQYGTGRGGKKAGVSAFQSDQRGNRKLKPGIIPARIFAMFDVCVRDIGILHDADFPCGPRSDCGLPFHSDGRRLGGAA